MSIRESGVRINHCPCGRIHLCCGAYLSANPVMVLIKEKTHQNPRPFALVPYTESTTTAITVTFGIFFFFPFFHFFSGSILLVLHCIVLMLIQPHTLLLLDGTASECT